MREKGSYSFANKSNSFRGGETKVMKQGKKFIAVLSASAMLFGTAAAAVVVPSAASVAQAASAGKIETVSNPSSIGTDTVDPADKDHPDGGVTLSAVKITIPAFALNNNDSMTLSLPDGFEFPDDFYNGENASLEIPLNNGTVINSVYKMKFNVEKLLDNEIKITADGTQDNSQGSDGVIIINLRGLGVDGPDSGPIDAVVASQSGSGFPEGTVTVGTVATSNQINLAVNSTKTSNGDDPFTFNLRLREGVKGSFNKQGYIRIKLPSEYKWSETKPDVTNIFGNAVTNNDINLTVNDNNLDIRFEKDFSSSQPLEIQLNDLTFNLIDDDSAKKGDITATVTGTKNVNVSSLVVGTYGDYDSSVEVGDVPTIFAGKDEQEIAEITINESLQESLVGGRTIELTLPDGARWQQVYEALSKTPAEEFSKEKNPLSYSQESSKGLYLDFDGYSGTEGRTAKFKVRGDGSSDDGASVTLKNIEVVTQAGFSGDLKVEVSGSAGLEDELTVAKVIQPFTAKASNVTNLKAGTGHQAIGTFTVSETEAGAFTKDSKHDQVTFVLDTGIGGVAWDGTPTVKVTEGDLRIASVRKSGDTVYVTLDGESSEPSTIEVSGGTVVVDKAAPETDVLLKVKGNAAQATAGVIPSWASNTTAVSAKVATIGNAGQQASFTIGSTTLTVNGEEQTMDVAPFVSGDRAFLPIRYAAQVSGVSDDNIIWNPDTYTVTIMKGDRIIQLTNNSDKLVINGSTITMDVKTQVKDDRMFLPIRYVAQALGATVDWDQDTQTVTIN